jgi:hypothetical protein
MSNQPTKKAAGYYIRFRGQTTGPHKLAQVREGIASGSISRLHDVSRDQVHWYPIHTRPVILQSETSQDPAQPPQSSETADNDQVKTNYVTPHETPGQAAEESGATPPTKPRQNISVASRENHLPELDSNGEEDIIEKILKEPRQQ